jgi:hypothetical protein
MRMQRAPVSAVLHSARAGRGKRRLDAANAKAAAEKRGVIETTPSEDVMSVEDQTATVRRGFRDARLAVLDRLK